jgi:hypothetical protein
VVRQHGQLFIRLATRYERKVDILTGLIHLACALICLPQAQAVVKRPLSQQGERGVIAFMAR